MVFRSNSLNINDILMVTQLKILTGNYLLEQKNYFSSKNKRLNNYELYKEFYRLTSSIKCNLVKVLGHQVSSKKDQIDKLFGLVDKASRRALREEF